MEVADKINEVAINKCGVFHLCAERAAAFNMYQYSGQTKMKRVLAFRDKPPYGGGSGMPCGACREFLMELNPENRHLEFMLDFENEKRLLWENSCLTGGGKNVLKMTGNDMKHFYCMLE